MPTPLMDIRNATKVYGGGFLQGGDQVVALQDFNLTIYEDPATITTIAGESGSGKTTLANLVLGFVTLTSGQVIYKGAEVAAMNSAQQMEYRREVQAVFQDPTKSTTPSTASSTSSTWPSAASSWHPAQRSATHHRRGAERGGMRGEEVLQKYPHQLSGGQRQRMMVARAFLLKPRIIVADEPVSMVDASLRAMILDIMLRMRDDYKISFLYITHDLSTAYQVGDQIYILYQGSVAERGETAPVIENPSIPTCSS